VVATAVTVGTTAATAAVVGALKICSRGEHGLEKGLQQVSAREGCLLRGWLPDMLRRAARW
jgi:hypothetical protein